MHSKTHLPLEVIRNDEAKALEPGDIIAVHELLNRVFLEEDGKWRIVERIYDQLSVLGSLIPDITLRAKASENLSP
ncbi:MAG: hypothetical protein HC939_12380 [Pleurocapsa sp. SU_5_0]|nr:hypothetical protein [Pleurocapsa sp. SU_5_0]NJO95920.1 hypothetical protein [Pleurocapsa sp. CRU_1_2]NJR46060.1 hypothetical protein [Hyellaceae cyanobacterium CSU_1_1]